VPTFSRRVREALLDRVDIYGLNEDELQSYLGRPVDLLDAAGVPVAKRAIPIVAGVLLIALWLRSRRKRKSA